MRVDALTPVLRAAPGERATCRLRIENTDAGPLSYGLRVVGFDENQVLRGPPTGPLASGSAEEVELEFLIPDAYAAGHHSVAVEVTPDRPGSAPVIAGITVAVGQIDDVAMAVVPSTVRGHRRGKFRLDIDNRSLEPVDLDLGGEGPDLRVTLRPDRVELLPGDRVRTAGKVKAPRHLVGEPRQHSFTVTARSRSAPSYAPATFYQRPFFPRSLRTLLAVLLIVSIWAGALGAGVYWWNQRGEEGGTAHLTELVDTDGDGVPDTPADELVDTDGDGVPDTRASVVAAQVAAAGEEPQEGGSDVPTRIVIGGTVKAGETGEDEGVSITLRPIDLNRPVTDAATAAGLAGESRGLSERRPARPFSLDEPGVSTTRRTVSVKSRISGPDGAWEFPPVLIRRNYELHFAQEGYDSQSFVITPPEDGASVEMDVVLEPAEGEVSGTVIGPGGPLGNVDLVLTDGELTFNTTTASDGDTGSWSLSGISTPGVYTLTATLRGYGTEVLQIPLEAGEQRSDVNVSMVPDVGSITGRISDEGSLDALGGVTLTASSGDTTITTTSLTEGDKGFYAFPRLTTPGRYTVTASHDGYVAQSRLVTLGGNVTGIDFQLTQTTGMVSGVVTSVDGPRRGKDDPPRGPLDGASVVVSREELSFKTDSSSEDDIGRFRITDVPPGTYRVEFSKFDHRAVSKLVTVAAGKETKLGRIPLRFRPRGGIDENGGINVSVEDSQRDPLTGATITVHLVSTGERVRGPKKLTDTESTWKRRLPVGTYEVTGTKPQYKQRTVVVSVGPEKPFVPVTLTLFKQGQVRGRIVDSLSDPDDPTPLREYQVAIHEVRRAGGEPAPTAIPGMGGITATVDGDDIFWQTPSTDFLPVGFYAVKVVVPPDGYIVRDDQIVQSGQARMQFEVPAEGEDVIVLRDLEADPLPNIDGEVLAPNMNGRDPFEGLNSETLVVKLECPNGEAEGQVGNDLREGLDAFSFDRGTVSDLLEPEDEMNGVDCSLDFSTHEENEDDNYLPLRVEIHVEASDGIRDPDIVKNVAMFKATDVGGRAYWLDRGDLDAEGRPEQVPAEGIEVSPIRPVITGFRPSSGAGDPSAIERDLPTRTTDEHGLWAWVGNDRPERLDKGRQVFGTSTYEFSDPDENYADRRIAITIGEDGRTVDAVPSTDPPSPDCPPPAELGLDDEIGVQLDADGGPIEGTVELRSTTLEAADFSQFVMHLTGAGVSTKAVEESGVARVETCDPGTYFARMTIPGHYWPLDDLPQSDIELPQEPGAPVGFSRKYIELAEITVTVKDGLGNLIPDATVSVDPPPGVIGPPPPPSQVTGPDGVVTFSRLPVSPALGSTATYQIEVIAEGHDVTNNTMDVAVFAGSAESRTITLPAFGSITGTVVGQVPGETNPRLLGPARKGPPPDPADPDDPVVAVYITARRQYLLNGTKLPFEGIPVGEPLVVEEDGPNGFSVSGPPGWYTIEVSHEDYDPGTAPSFDPPIPGQPPAVDGLPVYRMTNLDNRPDDVDKYPDVANAVGQWVLDAKPGILDVTVHDDELTGANVPNATIGLAKMSGATTDPIALGPSNLTEDPPGRFRVTGLAQGSYVLTVSELDDTPAQEPLSFPVIVTVSIPFGHGDNARTRVVHAPLARIGGEIVGEIVAENSDHDRLPVPTLEVSRDYTPKEVQIGSPPDPSVPGTTDLIANRAPSPRETVEPEDDTDDDGDALYRFLNLPTGAHVLHFPEVTGYTNPPTTLTADVISVTEETNVDPVTYTADDRTVIVHVTTGGVAVDDATVTLTHAGDDDPALEPTSIADGAYTFDKIVPPEMTAYTVTVSKDDLHRTQTTTVLVEADDPNTPIHVPERLEPPDEPTIELPAISARIIGLAQKRPSSSSTLDFDNEGTATLIDVSAEPDRPVDTYRPGGECVDDPDIAHCNFLFDIPVGDLADDLADNYVVRLELGGFARRVSAVFSPELGATTNVPTLPVPALATMEVTVSGPAPNDPMMDVEGTALETGTVVAAAARSREVFTFSLDPGDAGAALSYDFEASAPGFVSATVPDGPFTFTPAARSSGSVTLTEETVTEATLTGTVTPAASNTRVELREADGDLEDVTATDGSGFYSFDEVDAGTWQIVSERFRMGRYSVTRTLPETPSVTVNVALAARPVNVAFTVSPTDATVELLSGTRVVDSTPPLVANERELPLRLRVSRDGFVSQTVDVPLPSSTGSFDATSFAVSTGLITLQPVPTTTTPSTTTTPPTAATPPTAPPTTVS